MEGVPGATRVDVACEVAVGVCSSGIFALTIDDNKSKSKSRFNRAQSFLTMPHRTSITNSRINPPLKKRHRCPLPRPTITKARHTNITLRRNIKVLRHLAMLQHRKPDVPTPQNCVGAPAAPPQSLVVSVTLGLPDSPMELRWSARYRCRWCG